MSLIPPRLRASRADVLPLTWTAAHAFAVGAVPQRRGPVGAALRVLDVLWVAPRLLLYFPVIATGVRTGGVARVDRHALLLVMPGGSAGNWRARGVLLGMVGLDMLVLLPVFTGLALVLPVWLAATVLGGPVLLDAGYLLWRTLRRWSQVLALAARQRALRSQGVQVLRLTTFAAHPRGRGHGDELVRQLLPTVPPATALLVLAINQKMADHYTQHYGFTPLRPPLVRHPLTLER